MAGANGTNRFIFSGSDITNKTVTISSGNGINNHFGASNITVDAGAVGYSIVGGGSYNRAVILNADPVSGFSSLDINENFSFGSTANSRLNVLLNSNTVFTVAAGKTLTFAGALTQQGEIARHISLLGGGTVVLSRASAGNGAGGTNQQALAGDWTIGGGSTLDVVALGEAASSALGSGSVHLNGGHLLVATGAIISNSIVVSGTNNSLKSNVAGGALTLTGTIVMNGTEGNAGIDFGDSNVSFADGMSFTLGSGMTNLGDVYEIGWSEGEFTGNTSSFLITNLGAGHRAVWDMGVDGNGYSYLTVTIVQFDGKILHWQGGSGTWANENSQLWDLEGGGTGAFVDGDVVMIGASGAGGTISLGSDVSPTGITVTGDQDWVIAGNGFEIKGSSSLVMQGSGTLTLDSNNSYSGGTYLQDGTLIIQAAGALGTSNVYFEGGTLGLDLSEEESVLDNSKFVQGADSSIKLDLMGKEYSFAADLHQNNTQLELSGGGSLSFAGVSRLSSLTVAEDTTALLTGTGTGNTGTNGVALHGAGLVVDATTSTTHFKFGENGFTGTLSTSADATSNASTVLIIDGSTAQMRMALDLNHQNNTGFVLTSAAAATLYLSSLSGNSNIAYSYSITSATMRHIDLELSEQNTYGGSFVWDGSRMGSVIVGSAGDEHQTLTLLKGLSNNVTDATRGALVIKNAAVELLGENAVWNGQIQLTEETSTLVIKDRGATAMERSAAAGEISGFGQVVIDNSQVTFMGVNSYEGGTRVINDATLKIGVVGSVGAGEISLEGGTLDLNSLDISNIITAVGGGNSIINTEGYTGMVSLSQHAQLTLTESYTASVHLQAGSTLTFSSTQTPGGLGNEPIFTLDSITGNGTLAFDLVMLDAMATGKYVIASANNISGNWLNAGFAGIELTTPAGADYGWDFDAEGNLVLIIGDNNRYWRVDGGTGNGNWDMNGESNWSLAEDGSPTSSFGAGVAANFIGDGTNKTTITVSGAVSATVLRISNGEFTFTGDSITLSGGLVVGGEAGDATATFENSISMGGNLIIQGAGSSAIFETGGLTCNTLANEGTITVKQGDVTLQQAVGELGGTLDVQEGNLNLGAGLNQFEELTVSGQVTGNRGTLSVGGDSSLAGLSGGGALEVRDGTTNITGEGETILSALSGAGKLITAGDLTLKGASSIGDLTLGSGNLTIAESLTVEGSLTAHNITITSVDMDRVALTVGESINTGGNDLNFTMSEQVLTNMGLADGSSYTLASFGEEYLGDVWLNGESSILIGQSTYEIVNDGDSITITRTFDPSNSFYQDNVNMSWNSLAGSILLDDAVVSFNPQDTPENHPDLVGLMNQIDIYISQGELGAANQLAAALAGAEVATLGAALKGDLERQMRYLRNRTMSMGVNPNYSYNDLPYFNAWMNAEGNTSKLSADSTLPGYSLDSWGGSFGIDANLTNSLTLGMAFTAMYGDLSTDGAARGEGSLDTYYLSFFARSIKRNWTHSFMGTIGKADADMERTVNYGASSYTAKGDTDGYALGLMYELGYTMALNEEGTSCWQPVLNVAFMHNSLGSYTETGSDAALRVGKQSNTYATLGLGARAEFMVGENLYNRASILQLRAMAKFDLGDRHSEADVALLQGTRSATVRSAEAGAVGAELGAGFIIPLGQDHGSLFMDAALELRSGYNNVNGTVGYRFTF